MSDFTRILGIETSCDETAAAIVENGRAILSNVIASQTELHAQYGGVFPEVASRKHIEVIHAVIDQAMTGAHLGYGDLDAIAVTRGPGLIGSLLIGVNTAKGIALARNKPLLGINHLEGHLYSLWLEREVEEFDFPILSLIVSGGHTELYLMTGHLHYQFVGGTLDDAAGEAFDKVGRLLGLAYPGGPAIEQAAASGRHGLFSFPRAVMDDGYNFSFSGLKTAVLRETQRFEAANVPVSDLAAGFQTAVVDALVTKTARATKALGAAAVHLVGGVSANAALRQALVAAVGVPVRYPPPILCTDNAAMIAAAAHWRFLAGQRDLLELDVAPNWPLA